MCTTYTSTHVYSFTNFHIYVRSLHDTYVMQIIYLFIFFLLYPLKMFIKYFKYFTCTHCVVCIHENKVNCLFRISYLIKSTSGCLYKKIIYCDVSYRHHFDITNMEIVLLSKWLAWDLYTEVRMIYQIHKRKCTKSITKEHTDFLYLEIILIYLWGYSPRCIILNIKTALRSKWIKWMRYCFYC